jgi:flagellar biosynthesis GTPase FlhF
VYQWSSVTMMTMTKQRRSSQDRRISSSSSLSLILFLLLLLLLLLLIALAVPVDASNSNACLASARPTFGLSSRLSYSYQSIISLRAGSSSEDDDDEDESESESADESCDDEDDESETEEQEESKSVSSTSTLTDTLLDLSKKTVTLVGRATLETAKALQRAVAAGLQGDDAQEEEEEPPSFSTKAIRTIQRMFSAAFTKPETSEAADVVKSTMAMSSKLKEKKSSKTKATDVMEEDSDADVDEDEDDTSVVEEAPVSSLPSTVADFGSSLANQYGVQDARTSDGPPFLGGTLTDALQAARSQARMLVVYIPSGKPNHNNADKAALETMLSPEIIQVANKQPKKKSDTTTGSFLYWGAKAGSSEAKAAMKRLQVKATSSKGGKRPILAIVYPAQTVGKNGRFKVVPKLLAQHHCTPPPTTDKMGEWLTALRKRHLKQYAVMQLAVKELKYFEERKKGYVESVTSDKERREREKIEKAERLAKEKEEKARQEAILKRREELKASLPPEESGATAKAIALRFADGKSDTRKFAADVPVSTLFNWVDGIHGIEREKVILTTLNGKQTFKWDDADVQEEKTLAEAGLGRMVGFRVTEKQPEEKDESK